MPPALNKPKPAAIGSDPKKLIPKPDNAEISGLINLVRACFIYIIIKIIHIRTPFHRKSDEHQYC